MATDIESIQTAGGASIQGNANAGGDFIGRDQYNFYTTLAPAQSGYLATSKELAAMYRQASIAHFGGDLTLAEELFERIRELDPSYPGVKRALRMIQIELQQFYIDMGGRVKEDHLILQRENVQREEHRRYIINLGSVNRHLLHLLLLVLSIVFFFLTYLNYHY